MDYIDDLVDQVKATARQAAEGVRDQADAAAKALEEEDQSREGSAAARDSRRVSEVGESMRGSVPRPSADPESFRGREGAAGGPSGKPWRR